MSAKKSENSLSGPLLVALGAFLWATDALFRSNLVKTFQPLEIVFITHVYCTPLALLFVRRFRVSSTTTVHWLCLLVLSLGGSIAAMVLFTKAFAITTNYTIPILVQKLQPLFAVVLAIIFLREQVYRRVLIYGFIALAASWGLSFGFAIPSTQGAQFQVVTYALGAAIIWAGCTVTARKLLQSKHFLGTTAMRYLVALAALSLMVDSPIALIGRGLSQWQNFLPMACGSGFLAIVIYYFGLRTTDAHVATFCELTFPLGAITINWLWLESPLTGQQIFFALLLITSVLLLSNHQTRSPVSPEPPL